MELYFGFVVGTRMPCVRGKGWEAQLLWRPGGFEIQKWGSLNRKSETWRKSNFFKKVCPSCRAFFRRSVQSGYNATYFCIKVCQSWVVADRVSVIFHIKDGNCEVTLKTRKNCQYCRYKWVSNFMPTHSRIYIIWRNINFVWNYFMTIRIFNGISAAKHSWAHNVLTSNLLSWLNTLRTWGQLGIRTVEYWFCLDEQDFTKRKTLES